MFLIFLTLFNIDLLLKIFMVRCFIGIFLPKELRDKVVRMQNELKKLPIDCKFVEESNLHISLSFLGEVTENEISGIEEKMKEMSSMYKQFDVFIKGLKLIPNEKFIRVIAFDTKDKSGQLFSISKMIEKEIGGDVKPPHLTLCRVKNIKDKSLLLGKTESLKDTEIGSFTATGISLIKSELQRQGPVYSVISEAGFSG